MRCTCKIPYSSTTRDTRCLGNLEKSQFLDVELWMLGMAYMVSILNEPDNIKRVHYILGQFPLNFLGLLRSPEPKILIRLPFVDYLLDSSKECLAF